MKSVVNPVTSPVTEEEKNAAENHANRKIPDDVQYNAQRPLAWPMLLGVDGKLTPLRHDPDVAFRQR